MFTSICVAMVMYAGVTIPSKAFGWILVAACLVDLFSILCASVVIYEYLRGEYK